MLPRGSSGDFTCLAQAKKAQVDARCPLGPLPEPSFSRAKRGAPDGGARGAAEASLAQGLRLLGHLFDICKEPQRLRLRAKLLSRSA